MKTGRREFIGAASLAAVSWPACASVQSTPLFNERATGVHSCVIVFDESLPDSRAFALRSRTQGARTMPLGNDIGALWFQHLMPLVSSPGHTVTGLTTHADAFLLTRLALGLGLRIERHSAEAHAGPDTLVMWRLDSSGAMTDQSVRRGM
jgi:hypothetical protein